MVYECYIYISIVQKQNLTRTLLEEYLIPFFSSFLLFFSFSIVYITIYYMRVAVISNNKSLR